MRKNKIEIYFSERRSATGKKNYSNVISSSEFIGWLCVSKCVNTLCIIGVCVRGASAHSIFIKYSYSKWWTNCGLRFSIPCVYASSAIIFVVSRVRSLFFFIPPSTWCGKTTRKIKAKVNHTVYNYRQKRGVNNSIT